MLVSICNFEWEATDDDYYTWLDRFSLSELSLNEGLIQVHSAGDAPSLVDSFDSLSTSHYLLFFSVTSFASSLPNYFRYQALLDSSARDVCTLLAMLRQHCLWE